MIITNAKIVLPDRVIENGYIVIESGIIQGIGEGTKAGDYDAKGAILMPGFIDIHVHGAAGFDTMTASKEELKVIGSALLEEGVTTYLATTLTADYPSLERVMKTIAEAKGEIPNLGGIHLEGPFINEKYKGAQNPEYIVAPDCSEFQKWIDLSNHNVRLITMAPETEGTMDFINYAVSKGVTVSAGHSDATMAQVKEAMAHGLTNLTHLHNAMSGHHHRHPGIVTSAFAYPLYAELIGDGIHVVPDVINAMYQVLGPDRFILITDGLKAKHSDLTEFDLFGLPCQRKDGAAYLKSGPLAGSLLSFDQGVRNIEEYTGASLVDLAKMTSTNAARSLHMFDRGSIEVGKKADLVLLDEKLNLRAVFVNGNKVR